MRSNDVLDEGAASAWGEYRAGNGPRPDDEEDEDEAANPSTFGDWGEWPVILGAIGLVFLLGLIFH